MPSFDGMCDPQFATASPSLLFTCQALEDIWTLTDYRVEQSQIIEYYQSLGLYPIVVKISSDV